MICIIEGLGVGSGKSYLCLTKLLVHFCRGGTAFVVDTFELNWKAVKDYCYRRYGYVLEDDQYRRVPEADIMEVHKKTALGSEDSPVVIVLDECQGQLNARDWNDKRRRELFAWACQSRHDDNDLWFISQNSANIDKQVRRIATFTYRVRNTKNWGSHIITRALRCVKWLTFGLHPGAFFVVGQYDQDGKTLMGKKKWLEQDPELFKCYVSKAMRGSHMRSGEIIPRRKLERRQSKVPWRRWGVLVSVVGLLWVGCSKFFPSTKSGASPTPGQIASVTVEGGSKGAAYDTRTEHFRSGFSGPLGTYQVGTDKWLYVRGEMCPDGLVETISRGRIQVRQPSGRLLYIVLDRRGEPEREALEAAASRERSKATPRGK